MKLLLLLKTAITLCAIQVVNCRCVCDPADTTCLNNCVNNARNCIEDCGNNTCFTECINFHWPGTTFEDGIADELEEAEESTIRVTSMEKNDATTTAATRATTRATPTATTEVDFIGALISAIFNPSIQETTAASNLALKTEISDTASTMMPNSATPLSPLSEIASMLNLSNPFLTTTHTTITSLVTVTPTTAPSSSFSGTTASATSFGSQLDINLIYPISLFILLTTVFIY